VLIDHGKVLYDGGVEQLKARYAPHRQLVVQLGRDEHTGAVPTIAAGDLPDAEIVEQDNGVARIRFETQQIPVQTLIAAVNARYPVVDLSIVEPDLEGVVRQIYQEKLTVV
jgi:ABC-2 type transport system ATP-binding protein